MEAEFRLAKAETTSEAVPCNQKKVASPGQLVSGRPVPPDRYTSALAQVPAMIADQPFSAWSKVVDGGPAQSLSEQELAALLLAVNFELLGYSPEHAWLLAQRGEAAAPGRLDG